MKVTVRTHEHTHVHNNPAVALWTFWLQDGSHNDASTERVVYRIMEGHIT